MVKYSQLAIKQITRKPAFSWSVCNFVLRTKYTLLKVHLQLSQTLQHEVKKVTRPCFENKPNSLLCCIKKMTRNQERWLQKKDLDLFFFYEQHSEGIWQEEWGQPTCWSSRSSLFVWWVWSAEKAFIGCRPPWDNTDFPIIRCPGQVQPQLLLCEPRFKNIPIEGFSL